MAEGTLRAPVSAFRPDAPTGAVSGLAVLDTSDLPRRAFARRSIMASRRLPKRPRLGERDRRSLGGDNSFRKTEIRVMVPFVMSDWVQSATTSRANRVGSSRDCNFQLLFRRAYYSIFKRGVKGVYRHCGEKHLHRYFAEFDFRYSNRSALGTEDVARADRALRGVIGCRLTYNPTY
jgi:hypothetical protein